MMKIWAHRGASAYAPENTIPAFKLAAEMGADGVELDVQESADGKLVVIHDATVDRTTDGKGRVVDMTIRELKMLNAGMGFAQYDGARIPTLKEVYGLLHSTSLTINVELKCDEVMYWGIWEKCLALEKEMGMQGRILYSSFNHYVLRELLTCAPEASTALLYAQELVDPWVYGQYCKAKALHPHRSVVLEHPDMLPPCAKAGIDVNVWTVNEPEDMRALADAGVSAIITNVPDIARKTLG